ncbi:hypothetical protein A4A58_19110 [Tardiphaga robiniae]|uniref:Uncharacterized protein n=1 Tax=Tardiphaga robiniae TaxID=943830 RepID=A0A161QX06_9BRAD|nr:hypothetical protein A4A58_19110 [Tardiphaga robiniae]
MVEIHGNWPFQVAIPDDDETYIEATSFCSRKHLSLRVLGASVMHEGTRWVVFCFTYHRDAETLRNAFMGRWVHTHLWRPENYRETK